MAKHPLVIRTKSIGEASSYHLNLTRTMADVARDEAVKAPKAVRRDVLHIPLSQKAGA
jgi:hypothetical protein